MKPITLSVISSLKPAILTKRIYLDDNGKIAKSTAANMTKGSVQVLILDGTAAFAEQLQALEHNQALAYGVPKDADNYPDGASRPLFSKAVYAAKGSPPEALTRTKERFQWPSGPGVLLIDYDPPAGAQALSKKELIERVTEVLPELAQSAFVWWSSSSSLITNTETKEQLSGIKGQRLYILVANASDIERAGEVLFNRLWLAGHGHYDISRAGSALERSIIDASVWQPTRLDFAAGAQCEPPLVQDRGAPDVHEGDLLNTLVALPDLTEDEQAKLKTIKTQALELVQDDIAVARQLYMDEAAHELVKRKHGDTLKGEELEHAMEEARKTAERACRHSVLFGEFVITLEDGQQISIGEVLDDPGKYHGKLTLDPLEPEYCGNKVVGKLYLTGARPNLFSHAHGGRNYRLVRQPREIEHVKGKDHEATRQTLEVLRQSPDVYDMGSEMVWVEGGESHRFIPASLGFWLGGEIQYWGWRVNQQGKRVKTLLNPPPVILNQLLALNGTRNLKSLKAVITAPVITRQGRVLERIGYDAETQLYLAMQDDPPPVPASVDVDAAIAAAQVLLHPFRGFSLATRLDRGVLLALALTAVLRPVLPTAPAGGVDAPVQASGKTLLAQCLGALATGMTPGDYPHTAGRDDEETRKRITSILAQGERVIVWDNILGHFDSAAMASLLTAETFKDRILGKSEIATLPNRALVLLTGNNLALAGDMPRRVLLCRLDAGVQDPAHRKFDFDALREVKDSRQQLVQAALVLVRGYQQSDAAKTGGAEPGESTASFEDWDELVRQPCAWLARLLPDQYQDPADALKNAIANDPEKEMLGDMLKNIGAVMGFETWFGAKELHTQLTGFIFASDPARQELADALASLMHGKMSVSGLGRVLGYRVGRLVDDMRLMKQKTRDRLQFCVERSF